MEFKKINSLHEINANLAYLLIFQSSFGNTETTFLTSSSKLGPALWSR